MALNYVVVVDDGGEMKTVAAAELEAVIGIDALEDALNKILDEKAIAAGEYDPSENDEPFVVAISGYEPDDAEQG